MVLSNILVVIDPTNEEQIALKRAEQIAVDCGAELHLFCCDYTEEISDFDSRKDAKHAVVSENKLAIESLADPLRKEGITVNTASYWNNDWQKSILRAAEQVNADLIIKSSFYHTKLQRKLKPTSDYKLLRHSPCSVLLVKNDSPWMQQKIVAALALDTDDREHISLNRNIMTQARVLATATQSELHIASAFVQKNDAADALKLLDSDIDSSITEESLGIIFNVDPSRVHLKKGEPQSVIVEITDELRADLLIIGTVARKGISGLLLGNTAEKILDSLEMDILVVN